MTAQAMTEMEPSPVNPQDPDYPFDAEPEADDDALHSGSGRAPAESLASVQIRRRTPAKARRAGRKARPAPTAHAAEQTPPAAVDGQGNRAGDAENRPADTRAAVRRTQAQLVEYWTRLRGGRPVPARSDLETREIEANWPDSMLLRCRAGSGALQPEQSFGGMSAPEPSWPPNAKEANGVEPSPLMLQWLLSLAQEAVRDGAPVRDNEAFPGKHKAIRYHGVALPFGEDRSKIDHVLCHVHRED